MKKAFFCGIAISFAMALLCGCAKNKQVDYNLNAETEEGGAADDTNKTEESPALLSQFSGAERWTEEWVQTGEDDSTLDIHIDADIVVPEADYMSVVEVHELEMDTDYKEQVLNAFFGDTEITPYEESISYSDAYLGEVDGITYEFMFREKDSDGNKMNYFGAFPLEEEAILPEELNVTDMDEISWGDDSDAQMDENQCELSEQEARNIAERMLSDMGINSMVLVETKPVVWGSNRALDEETGEITYSLYIVDGYSFDYDLGLGELSFTDFGSEYDYRSFREANPETAKDFLPFSARASFFVTDKGVIKMEVSNGVEITEVTKEVELLPLEKIQNIICNELSEDSGQFSFTLTGSKTKLSFDSMELIYFRMRDDTKEGYYSYVPAWRLCDTSTYTTDGYSNVILINAIDGSVIDLLEELQ